jgi:hypothetical protein
MRLEPRWNPDLAASSQIKADFFGRIMIAASNCEKNIKGNELYDLILGDKPNSLYRLSDSARPYFCGPLEGAENSPNSLPTDFSKAIKAQLSTDEVGPSSFIALVNSAMIFPLGLEQAELAAEALKLGSHRLANIESRSQLMAVLIGLATVAAVARGQALADELRILVRRYRRDTEYALSIKEAIQICLVASASRAELNEWRECVGSWVVELAFDNFEDKEGKDFYSHLQCLCHVVPELWVSCGRADAALRAYCAQ